MLIKKLNIFHLALIKFKRGLTSCNPSFNAPKWKIFILAFFMIGLNQIVFAQTNQSNITISTSPNSNGAWTGAGTIASPFIFTPTALNSNILSTDLVTKLNTGYVTINTAYTGGTVGAGTIVFSTPITSTSSLTTARKFVINAYGNITVSNAITLSTTNAVGNENYLSSSIEFNSSNGNININALVKTIPSNMVSTSILTGANGGDITLTASAGIISMSNLGSLESNGQYNPNPSTSAKGGNGGNIILNGINGISLLGALKTDAGNRGLGSYIGSFPGNLTVNTNNTAVTSNVNDGQGASTFTFSIGNLIKQGTGTFSLKSSTYGGYVTPGYNIYSPSVTVSAGTLRLLGATSLYDFADIVIASGATFNLNAFSETISTIEGAGTITSATAATLTLLYNNPDPAKLITTFSGTISGAISLYKTSNQVDNHGYLYLTGSGSSYTGTTTVRIGGILVGHANALGAASGTTTVLNGATVGVFGGISIAEPFNIRGNGEGGIGVLRDSSGINTFTGAITLDSTAYITTLNGTSSDSLRLGAVNLGTYTLTIFNNAGIQAMGVIAGSGSIIKTGSSTVKLSAANTYTGFTKISNGSILLGANDRLAASDIYLDGGTLNTGGFTDALGKLFLSKNSQLTFGSAGAHTLTFSSADNYSHSNILTINNWEGTYGSPGTSGTAGKLLFTSRLAAYQIDHFNFYNSTTSSTHIALQLTASNELVAGNDKSGYTSGHSNITISSNSTSGGTWTGDGGSATPYVFSPNADNANINVTEIQGYLVSSNGNVKIATANANGSQSGSLIINSPITASNTTATITNIFNIEAKGNLLVNQLINFSSTGASGSVSYKVPSIKLQSESGIFVYAGIKTSATASSLSGASVANGGDIELIATSGVIYLASTGYLEAKGANNTNATAGSLGGNGGAITINGYAGLTLISTINNANGYSNNTAATLNLSKPGTLTLNTNNTTVTSGGGVNDGQTTNTITVGNIIKEGAGTVLLTNSAWGGMTTGTTSFTSPYHFINNGILKFGSVTSMQNNSNVKIASSATLDLNSFAKTIGTIAGAGSVTSSTGTPVLTLASTNTDSLVSNFSGTLGSIALTKNSTDTLVLSGNNTASYTGITNVNNGFLRITNAGSLGQSSSTSTNHTSINGGTVQIVGDALTIPESFTISGTGYTTKGVIRNEGGDNTLSGTITLAAAATIVSSGTLSSDSLLVSGSINLSSFILTIEAAEAARIAGLISGTGGLTKTGTDVVLITNTNTYTGASSINAGQVIISNANALGTSAGATTISSGAAMQISSASSLTIAEPFTISGSGVSNTGVIRNLSGNGAMILSGAITTSAASRIHNESANLLTIQTGALINNGGLTIGADGNTTLTSIISGAGGITKEGIGTLILNAVNTYTGATTISAGVINIQNSASLGNATNALYNTIIASGAALQIQGTNLSIAEPITVSGMGVNSDGAIRNMSTSTGTNTLSGIITLAANTEINSDANILAFSGAIGLSTYNIVLGGAGNISSNGVISGSGTITKVDAGMLTLSGANTYSGVTTVNANSGILKINGNAAALGAVSGATIINTGSALQVEGGITFAAEPITISGTGINSDGVIRNISGNNTLAGLITAATDLEISADAGILSIGSAATTECLATSTYQILIAGSGGININGKITGSGALLKDGIGTTGLAGDNSLYTGTITANPGGGVISIKHANGLGAISAATTIYNGATLQIEGAITTLQEIVNIRGNGYGSLGAAFYNLSGNNIFSGTINIDSAASIGSAAGTLSLSNATNAIATNTFGVTFIGAGNTTISGLLNGSGALNKTGAGTLIMSGDNTNFGGAITATAGVINIQHNNALGTISTGTTVLSGASLQLQNNITINEESITINGDGVSAGVGAIRNISGVNTFTGNIILNAASRINADANAIKFTNLTSAINLNAFTLTIGGAANDTITGLINGSGTLTKDGAGVLFLSNDNSASYTGAIVLSAGVVAVSNQNALGNIGSSTTVNGGTLQINGNGLSFLEPLVLTGDGIATSQGALRNPSGQNTWAGPITVAAAGGRIVSTGTLATDSLLLTNTITANGLLTVDATKGFRIANIISGAGGLTKVGTDTLIVQSVNTYQGVTTISNGVLDLRSADGLGSQTAGVTAYLNTTVASGAALKITGNNFVIPEAILINGTGINTTGAIRIPSGTHTLNGLLTISTAARLNVEGTSVFNINTGGVTNTGGLTIGGVGNVTINGVITGSGLLTKDGISSTSTLTLKGNNNSYSGAITMNANAGVLNIQNSNALGTSGNAVYPNGAGGTFTIANGATAQQIALAACESLNGVGACLIGTCGYFTYYYKSGDLSCDCNKAVNTYEFIYANTGYTAVGSDYGGAATSITTAVPFTRKKSTAGCNTSSWTLMQSNLGSGVSGTTGNTTINSGSVLQIQGADLVIPENIIINGTGINNDGAIRNLAGFGNNTLSGLVTVNTTGSRINTDANTLTLSNSTAAIETNTSNALNIGGEGAVVISGLLKGGGTITKDGTSASSILTLKGNSTAFTGSIVVAANSNILKVSPTTTSNTSVLGTTSGSTTINTGSAMQIEGSVTLVAKPITIFGTGINNDGVIRNLSGTNTITGAVTVSSDARINTDAGTLTLNTAATSIALGAYLINFDVLTGATMTVSNIISGSAATNSIALIKSGVGKLVLGGTNTYTGATSIIAGVVQATNGSALGSTNGATTLESGAALEINGAISIPEAITINGDGLAAAPAGAIRIISGSGAATLSGLITSATMSRINSDAASILTISTGGITNTGGLSFGISTTGNISVTGVITGIGGITKDGAGTGKLVFSGSNTYQGATLINAGIIQATVNDALGSQTLGTLGYSNTTVSSGAALEINGSISSLPENILINGTGISNSGAIRMISTGSAATLSGVITTSTAARINNDAPTNALTISTGGIVNSGGLTFGILGTGAINVNGVISDIGTITKDGVGTGRLVLSGSNTYTGATTVSAGVLQVKNNDALGSSSVGVASSNTSVTSAAAIEFNGATALTVPEPITINGLGFIESTANGALRQIVGASATTLTGGITVAAAARINNETVGNAFSISTADLINTGLLTIGVNNTGDVNITSIINGAGGLTKDGIGAGALILNADNGTTYTGVTTVSAGLLKVAHSNALGSSSGNTSVTSGATIQTLGIGLNIPEPLTINGVGIATNQGALRNPSGYNIWSGAVTVGAAGARIVSTGVTIDGSDSLVLSNTLALSGLLTIDATKGIHLLNTISGTGGITKIGSDTLLLGGSNTYTGATIITTGVVQLQNQDGLGSTTPGVTGASNTTVSATTASLAAIKIVGENFVIPELISIYGTGVNGTGAIKNMGAKNTLLGTISIASAGSLISSFGTATNASDSLVIRGGITATNAFSINATRAVRIGDQGVAASIITGTGNIIKSGSDTLLLTGSNTYSGSTTINSGTIKLGAAGVINDSADMYMNGGNLSTGYNEIMRKLYITDNSTITLGQTDHTVRFVKSDSLLNKKTLLINGWVGDYGLGTTSGTLGKLITNDSLLSYQLDQIKFVNVTDNQNYYVVQLPSTKELVPKSSIITSPTDHSNVSISSAATTAAVNAGVDGWLGTGTAADPYIYKPPTDESNVNYIDLQDKIKSSAGNVQIWTSRAGGTKSGTIVVNYPITSTNIANASSRTLSLLARSNVVVYKDIVLSGSGNSGGVAYPVPNVLMQADLNDVVLQAGLKLNGTTQAITNDTTANGGDIILTATAGRVMIASNGYLESKGAPNTHATGAVGGNGGMVTLNGYNGVSILGNITTTNGARLGAGTDYSLSRPGTLVINTANTNPGFLDGQGSNTYLTVGNVVKKGAGKFVLARSYWAGHIGSKEVYYKAMDSVYEGILKLSSATSISDTASVYVATGATLDLGGYNEIVGTIAGGGLITSTGGTLTLNSLTTINGSQVTPINTLFSGNLSGAFALTKNGIDTLVLSGDNTTATEYSGITTITNGVVKLSNANALGAYGSATTNHTIVNGAGTVLIDSNNYTINELFTISADGVATTQGAIRNLGKVTTLAGNITLGASARITSAGYNTVSPLDSLIITGGINTANVAYVLTVDVQEGMRISGVISGAGGLTKVGNDTLRLTNANTYTAATVITNGVVQLENQDGLGSATPGVTGASTTNVSSGASIKIVGNNYVIPEVLNLAGTGINNFGVIYNVKGKNTLSGAISLLANASLYSDGNSISDSLLITGSINTGIGTPGITNGLVLNLDAGNSLSYTSGWTTWKDLSGSGNDATLINSPSFDATNGSISFNGINQNASLDPLKLVTGNTVTIGFWNNGGTAQNSTIFYAPNSYNIHLPWSDKAVYWDPAGNRVNTSALADADFQGWHYWVFTRTAVSPGTMTIYKDGVSIATGSSNTTAFAVPSSATLASAGTSLYHIGKIGVVQMYNRVLSVSEIEQNYNTNALRFGRSTIGLGGGQSGNITINSVKGVRISGIITGTGNIIKSGSDTLLLTGSNTYSGSTTINSGTIKLGAAGVINDSADMYMNGGNLSTGYNEIMRKLYITDNSTITLGQTDHTVRFVKSDSLLNKKTLLINGWVGDYGLGTTSGTLGKLITNDSLLSYQLDQIKFVNVTDNQNYYVVQLPSTKELVPKSSIITSPTDHSNVSISSAATTAAVNAGVDGWLGTGTAADPYIYKPPTDESNVNYIDLQDKIKSSAGNVQIWTSRAGGTKSGTIVVNYPITSTNIANASSRTLSLLARSNVVVYKDIVLSGSGNSGGVAYPVPNVLMQADLNDVVLQAGLKLNGTTQAITNDTTANGGDIILTATAGRVMIASNGYLESKGAPNTHATGAVGGNGGMVTLNGYNGVSILGNITTTNGARLGAGTDYSLSRPGTLVINTANTNPGFLDGQGSNTYLTVGNVVKKGAGKFVLARSYWAGHIGSKEVYYKAMDSVYEGILKLSSATSISDTASVYVATGATLDLGGYNEIVGTIAGGGLITSTGGTLTLNSLTTINGSQVTPINTLFSGNLSGAFALTKNGIDTLVLSGDNTTATEYSGITTITNGVVKLSNANALGAYGSATTNHTIVNGAGTVLIDSNNYTINELFTISADGVATTQGAIRNLGKVTTLAGNITLGASARITSAGYNTVSPLDSLIITGGINTANVAYVLTVDVQEGMRISGVISGAGGLTKVGNDTLRLTNANTYTAATVITNGVVQLENQDGLGSATPGVTGASTTTVSATTASLAAIKIVGENFVIPELISIYGTGVNGSGAIKNMGSKNTLLGKLTIASTSSLISSLGSANDGTDSLIIRGGITATNTFSINATRAVRIGDQGVVASIITGAGAMTKLGMDTLIMNSSNTYTGITNINTGVVLLKTATGLGSGLNGTTDHSIIASDAAVVFDLNTSSIPEYFTINGTGINSTGVLRIPSTSTGNTLSGIITVNANGSRINSDANILTLSNATAAIATGVSNGLSIGGLGAVTISGILTGGGTITKDGIGSSSILTLKGNSIGFTGSIVVAANSNILKVSPTLTTNTSVLGTTSGSTTINTGSALQIEGGVALVAKPIVVFGTGINNDGVIRNLTGNNTISGAVSLSSDARMNTDAGNLIFSAPTSLTLNSNLINFGVASGTTISVTGVISGTASNTALTLTKEGTGTLFLSGVNTYSGITTISAGTINVQNNAALGATTAHTLVTSGSALEIQNALTGLAEPLFINGTGVSGVAESGAIRSVSGANVLTGLITLNSASKISALGTGTSDSLVIRTGGINTDGNAITLHAFKGFHISGVISGSGATVTKTGTDTLILSAANTYDGLTTISNGVISIKNNDALGSAIAGTGDAYTLVNSGAALRLDALNNIPGSGLLIPEAITINGTGINTTGAIRNTYGINTLSNSITLGSAGVRINSSSDTLKLTNATSAISFGTYALNMGGSGHFDVSGLLDGTGNLIKDGLGTLILSGSNTGYSGAISTSTSGGVINVRNDNALGTTNVATTINAGAALQIENGVTISEQIININGTGVSSDGALRSISGTNSISGNVNLQSASRINVDAGYLNLNNGTSAVTLGAFALTFGGAGTDSLSGVLTGAGAITKDGSGILVLNADNGSSYTGNITTSANGGIIRVLNNNALGSTSGTTTVGSGSTIQLSGDLLSIPEPFILNGNGVDVNQGAIRNPNGNNTITGTITLASSARVVSEGSSVTDSLVLKGNIVTISGAVLSMDVIKGMRLTGLVSGAGGITKNNSDTLLFYGNTANTYSGITTINDGVVRIQNTKILGDSSSISTAHTIINGGTLLVDINGFTLAEPLTISGDGVLKSSEYQGALKTLYGINTLKGQVTLGANARINAGVISSTTDSLRIGLVNTGTATGYALTIVANTGVRTTGLISGLGSLVKEGLDTLKISTINTYTGYTKLTSGGLLLGANYVMPSTATNEFIFNGGYLISGGFTDTLGKLSVLDNSSISLKYLPIHGLTFSGKSSFVAGKSLVIYGWSGLTAPALSKSGKLISSNPTAALIYIRSSGKIGSSKSGGITQYGQVVSASLGNDFNGRIYFSNNTALSTFQLNRVRFYVDSSASYTSPYNYWSSIQSGSYELLASDTIKTDPIDVIPTSTLTTTAASAITNISATAGGNITAANDDAVIERGIVWSTSANPTIDLLTKAISGLGTGSFTANMTGLTLGTTYYVRAFARNSNTTSYGAQISFTTLTPPTLTSTTTPSSITSGSAISGGNISSANGFTMVTRGVVWSTSANPTILLSTKSAEASTAIGSFTASITGLTANTTYFLRSYATNTSGTDYGPQITFTSASAPNGLVSTDPAVSAYAIKQAYPASTDGFYWIQNPLINGGAAFKIYADMTTDGGGWTLIMKNSTYVGWTYENAKELNISNPFNSYADIINTSTANYSIIGFADKIKKTSSAASTFDYMIEANSRGANGAIWTANGAYSFVKPANTQTNSPAGYLIIKQKFGTWTYADSDIEERMPWYSTGTGFITTSADPSGNWWGTLVTGTAGWTTAPYLSTTSVGSPSIIWYWVR